MAGVSVLVLELAAAAAAAAVEGWAIGTGWLLLTQWRGIASLHQEGDSIA